MDIKGNEESKSIWVADVGGTSIKLAIIKQRNILERTEIPAEADRGLLPALDRMSIAWRDMSRRCGATEADCAMVGLAFPGIIDPIDERIWTTPAGKFDDSRKLDVREWCRKNLARPITICNDANAALAGEWQYGVARGCQNVCMMTLGTGVGTAVVVEGRPLRGRHGLAGNAGGHLTIDIHGIECLCGNIGCVESEGSSWAMQRQAEAHPSLAGSALAKERRLDYEAVFRLAKQGDALAQELLDRSLRAWATGAVNMVNSYDPDMLILGGGVMKSADIIIPYIREYLRRHAWAQWEVPVVPAESGNDAGLFGIAYLASRQVNEGK